MRTPLPVLHIYCDAEPVAVSFERHSYAGKVWQTCSRCGKRVRIAW